MTREDAHLAIWSIETNRFMDLCTEFALYPPPLPPPPPAKDSTLAQYLVQVEEWNRKVLMPALALALAAEEDIN